MSGDETKNIYEYFRYANHSTEESERKNINSNREKKFNTSIISPKKNDPLCAGYIFNTISLRGTKLPTSKLFEYLKNQKAKDRKVGNTTTPQYAALSGGITRSSTTPKNDGFIAPEVRFVVSISNKEDITIKLPEDTEYITIEGTKSLNYEEQWKLLLEADVIQPNDILYIGDGKNDRYIDMYHVVFMDSQETYSGQNSSVINGSVFETYIKPYIDSNSDNRLYFILVNSDEEMNEKLLEMYK